MKKPIILIGYMGAGKTTVGKLLAGQKGWVFIDTDAKIEEQEGRSISDIFATDGEDAFRDKETVLIRQFSKENLSQVIISVGGGLPLREENRRLLKEIGTVVYLFALKDTIVGRVKASTDRPLLQGEDLSKKVEDMFLARDPVYRQAADFLIETDEKTAEEITEEIWKKIEKEKVEKNEDLV